MCSPDDLYGSRFCSSLRTSAIWILVKEKLGRLGQVAAGGAELLAGVGVARRKAWPAVEKCLLKFSIIVHLSVVTVFPSLSAVGSWEVSRIPFPESVFACSVLECFFRRPGTHPVWLPGNVASWEF